MYKLKVMVVEDNELDMTLVTAALEASGIDYVAVQDSTKALEVALMYKPSIALLDMNMPELDGKQVMEQLKTHPLTNDIKIIFLSASESVDDVLYGVNLQASAYFKKGVRIGHLIESINAIDATTNIRESVNNFASHSKLMATKYQGICSTRQEINYG